MSKLYVLSYWLVAISSGRYSGTRTGPPPAATGAPGEDAKACTSCHMGTLNGGSGGVRIIALSGAMYIPGVRQRITVQVTDPVQQKWGFQLTARLNSDAKSPAGELVPVDNLTQVLCADASAKPCGGVSYIEQTSAGTRNGTKKGVTFQFDWVPPGANVGPVTFYVAANAANGSGPSGDFIYTSSLQLDPVTALAPAVRAGNIVSSATGLAGPVGANSWMTVYGSNLSATTRSWADSDFVDGGLPDSLDGVSVVLSTGGVPRLASVGYVSPAQVNFLVPSDAAAGTVQITTQEPSRNHGASADHGGSERAAAADDRRKTRRRYPRR